MDDKKNQILIGVILVLVGIYSLMYQIIDIPFINMENLTALFLSGAFLILYYTKKKTWALIIGIILGFFGILGLVKIEYLFTIIIPVILILLGLTFIRLYYSKGTIEFLIAGSILFWLSIFIMIILNKIVPISTIPDLFFASIGAIFITMYILGRPVIEKWALILGGIFLFLGFILFIGISLDIIFVYIPIIIPIILIGIGIFIVIYSRKMQ